MSAWGLLSLDGRMEGGKGNHLLVDVGGAEAQQGASAADVVEVVVGVCHTERADVLSRVVVRVADQRSLGLDSSIVSLPFRSF